MLAARFLRLMELKNKGGIKLPEPDMLGDLVVEAILSVASKCVPSDLLERYKSPNMQVFRNVGNECFIRMPKTPDFLGEPYKHIDINEDLAYAVLYETLYLLNKEPFFKTRALEIIADYNANEGKDIDDIRKN
ncbi:hypothetical protein [Campylobacter gastrosuis]|uniref:Uncharacterized protein n=1 Tax=Campylobacter gastrosuis TaxID=2974576 RepID=A0ABT7HT99_9BACT|nr:hypothetical protein [Campylobacter gastrosuis]MDL0090028.1 hypothetical protein [Campylobacter gastrosuis]